MGFLARVGGLVGVCGGVGGGDDGEVEVLVAARSSPAGGGTGGGEASWLGGHGEVVFEGIAVGERFAALLGGFELAACALHLGEQVVQRGGCFTASGLQRDSLPFGVLGVSGWQVDATAHAEQARRLARFDSELADHGATASGDKPNVDPPPVDELASLLVGAGGRVVAFESNERRLVQPPDTDGSQDVFARDIRAKSTALVDVPSVAGVNFWDADLVAMSPDGRYVAFFGCAVVGSTNRCYFELRDRVGLVSYRIPQSKTLQCEFAAVSSRGRYTAYTTPNGLVVWDRLRGTVQPFGTPPPGVRLERWPRVRGISADGRYILFDATQRNRHNGPRSHINVWVWDQAKQRTIPVNISSSEHGPNRPARADAISGNGRYVMFDSGASNLIPGDTNGVRDVFARDLILGTTHRVNVGTHHQQADNTSHGAGISNDGRYRLFLSKANNLIPGDTNHQHDLFLRDRATGKTRRINLSPTGAQTNGNTWSASLSLDGHWVALDSAADNLVPRDTNKRSDVFLLGPVP